MSLPVEKISEKARVIREHIIRMLLAAGSGHAAGSLGLADVFAALYFGVLKFDPKRPNLEDRDRFILSNGHVCPVWYATLAEAGFFPAEELKTLRKLHSRLQGHPIAHLLPGVENTSGSLGQGLSFACGVAQAAKLKNQKQAIYCVMGDGEQDEGQVWEAYTFAVAHRLDNLTVIIDRNAIQSEGYTEDILPLEPLAQKLNAFGLHVQEIDGHNIEAIIDACKQARAVATKPSVIIANTIPGKDIEFMEGEYAWHAKAPNKEQAQEALRELRSLKGKIQYD
jgi:transketolase